MFHVKSSDLIHSSVISWPIIIRCTTLLGLCFAPQLQPMGLAQDPAVADAQLIFATDDHQPALVVADAHTAHQPAYWGIHIFAVPSNDGESLFISTGQTNALAASVSGEVATAQGPRSRISMSYVVEVSAYQAEEVPIGTGNSVAGTISLTADEDGDGNADLDSNPVNFVRFFVQSESTTSVLSDDIDILINEGSLQADRAALLMDTNGPRGPLPLGYQLVWKPYTLRVAGAEVTAAQPIELSMKYNDLKLGAVDPHTLTILQWEPAAARWQDLGGALFNLIDRSVVTQTQRFSDYALAAAPRWVDDFGDATGLAERVNVDILVSSGELLLDGLSLSGSATSKPITPTVAAFEWGTLTYSRSVAADTSLTIDLLDATGDVLISNVASGSTLADIDPALHPSLRLRANYTTDDTANSPRLDGWRLTWIATAPELDILYLPLITNLGSQ